MSDRDRMEAFVTLATNDTYSLGCLVLGASLRNVGTRKQLAVMVTTGVSNTMRSQLAQVFDYIQEVNVLDSKDPINLALLGRPDLNVTFTKLHCWRLTQYNKAVFLDADTLVLQNVDELLDREEFSAAPDAGWPDCFNSGVFVFKPSLETYTSLLEFATSQGSFDGGDQGVLNMFFKNWATDDIAKHLPFVYNVVSQAFYSYLPAFTKFKDHVRIVHFIGAVKPWHHTYDTTTGKVTPLPGTGHSQEFLQVWWNIFMRKVQPNLDPTLTLFYQSAQKPDHIPSTVLVNTCNPTSETLIKFPFTPPDVGEVFYDVSDNFDAIIDDDESPEKKLLIEKSLLPRSYTEFESHYTETPLLHIDPDFPPKNVYEASSVTKCWEKTKTPPTTPIITEPSMPPSSPEILPPPSSYGGSGDGGGVATEGSTKGTFDLSGDSGHPTTEMDGHSGEEDEHTLETEVGLVGQLASLTVSSPGAPAPQLSDQERKLNWEKGQIDYLGSDAFDNIQKKIDHSLKAEVTPEPTPVTSSPFEPPQEPIAAPVRTIMSIMTTSTVRNK